MHPILEIHPDGADDGGPALPVAYIMMPEPAGLPLPAGMRWGYGGGVTSISDAYLQFITASFSVYLLPTLSRLQAKVISAVEIIKSLKFVLPAVGCGQFYGLAAA